MSLLHKITSSLFKKNKNAKICFIGLDSAGKSSIIKKIISNEFNEQLDKRTLGMSVEKISAKGLSLITWDLGGQKAFRDSLWSTYMKGAQGLIYVIDSSNLNRLIESKQELYKYIFSNSNFNSIPILILANKQDLPHATSANAIYDFLELKNCRNNVKLLPVSCKSGLNFDFAMDWLANQIMGINFDIKHYNSPVLQTMNI